MHRLSAVCATRFRSLHPLARVAMLASLITLAISMIGPGAVSAHTGFGSSTPSDGAVVESPVDLVTISFTGEANPVGDEFVALTPAGVVQAPVSVQTLDNKVFSIRFDPPLAGGTVGLRWNVQAADAHPIEGAFSFTVTAPAPTTAPPTTVSASTTLPQPVAAEAVPISAEPTATTSAAAPTDDLVSSDPDDADPDDTVGAASAAPTEPTQSIEEFLSVDNSVPGETTATVGRVVGFLGVLLGLGALAFVATTLAGRREEVRRVLAAVRILGIVIAFGAAIEYVGVARMASDSLGTGWSTAPGFATVLRLVGGVGLAAGIAGSVSRRSARGVPRAAASRSLSAAVVADDRAPRAGDQRAGVPHARERDDGPIVRWRPDVRCWPALAGTVMILASFWFDGHTVSKGFRPLHALVNSVHVAAGAVWVGGVVTLAGVVWSRARSDQPMRVVELVVRFSRIATIALAAVIAAGGVMAFLVLDSFGDLTGTQWGKILLLKTAAVGVAAFAGAYNHFRLLPALEADPESPELLVGLRNTVIAEAIVLVFVAMVTAWLVTAAS